MCDSSPQDVRDTMPDDAATLIFPYSRPVSLAPAHTATPLPRCGQRGSSGVHIDPSVIATGAAGDVKPADAVLAHVAERHRARIGSSERGIVGHSIPGRDAPEPAPARRPGSALVFRPRRTLIDGAWRLLAGCPVGLIAYAGPGSHLKPRPFGGSNQRKSRLVGQPHAVI